MIDMCIRLGDHLGCDQDGESEGSNPFDSHNLKTEEK